MNDYLNYLEHSAKGSTWKKHKYVRKENGKYVYDSVGTNNINTKQSYERSKKDDIYDDVKKNSKYIYDTATSAMQMLDEVKKGTLPKINTDPIIEPKKSTPSKLTVDPAISDAGQKFVEMLLSIVLPGSLIKRGSSIYKQAMKG